MSRRVGVVISTEFDGGAEEYTLRLYAGLSSSAGADGVLLGRMIGWSELGFASIDIGLGPKWSFSQVVRAVGNARRERRAALAAIRAEHRRLPFDVFHLQFKREQILLSKPLSMLAPVVWTEHGQLPRGRGRGVVRMAYRMASRSVTRIICVSEGTADDVRRTCGATARVTVIENAVDERRFRPPATATERRAAQAELGITTGGMVIGVVARLHPDKRVDRALLAAGPGLTVVIAGDGPDKQRLERLAQGRPATFLGWVEEPSAVYRAADAAVMCFSSRGEGFPTVLIEAAASGCALVGFRGDVINAEIEQAGGLLIDAGTQLGDTDLLETLEQRQRAAREWAADHAIGPWLERHHAVLEEAAACQARRGRFRGGRRRG
jgi:glycosyltransferase involved in cell wall biosynthesis